LGFAPTLSTRDLKVKVQRCIRRLADQHVVILSREHSVIGSSSGKIVQLARGAYFDQRSTVNATMPATQSPLADLMRQIGMGDRAITRCVRQYSAGLLQQWLDITLAARERHGESFFKKSAAAYFVDNVQHAAQNRRTPPDWWHDLVREERRAQANLAARRNGERC
jgi:hypothetical protein